MEIEVRRMSGNWYKLFINREEMIGLRHYGKVGLRKYLKRQYGIDLRTDKRIRKNYTEFTQRLVKRVGKTKTVYIKPL